MDPYLIIEYQGHKHRTKTHEHGGKTPHWNHHFEMQVDSLSDDVVLKVYDQCIMSDDFVGYGVVKMSSLCINGGVNEYFRINYDEREAGIVHLQTQYF